MMILPLPRRRPELGKGKPIGGGPLGGDVTTVSGPSTYTKGVTVGLGNCRNRIPKTVQISIRR